MSFNDTFTARGTNVIVNLDNVSMGHYFEFVEDGYTKRYVLKSFSSNFNTQKIENVDFFVERSVTALPAGNSSYGYVPTAEEYQFWYEFPLSGVSTGNTLGIMIAKNLINGAIQRIFKERPEDDLRPFDIETGDFRQPVSYDWVKTGSTDNWEVTVSTVDGVAPFQYSIDGGQNFQGSNVFNGLTDGAHDLVVRDNNGTEKLETIEL